MIARSKYEETSALYVCVRSSRASATDREVMDSRDSTGRDLGRTGIGESTAGEGRGKGTNSHSRIRSRHPRVFRACS